MAKDTTGARPIARLQIFRDGSEVSWPASAQSLDDERSSDLTSAGDSHVDEWLDRAEERLDRIEAIVAEVVALVTETEAADEQMRSDAERSIRSLLPVLDVIDEACRLSLQIKTDIDDQFTVARMDSSGVNDLDDVLRAIWAWIAHRAFEGSSLGPSDFTTPEELRARFGDASATTDRV